jgi:hypothetical protein
MHSSPLVNAVVRAGHQVCAALRDPSAAVGVFDAGVTLLPAPLRTDGDRGVPSCGANAFSFARVLHNTAFGEDRVLAGLGAAWRNLFELVKPDLVLFDHAPAALFASRGLPFRRVVLGPGFNVLPDVSPFPRLRRGGDGTVDDDSESRLRDLEDAMVRRCNRVLATWGQPGMTRLGQLYSEVDETLLLTFAELDWFRACRAAEILRFN